MKDTTLADLPEPDGDGTQTSTALSTAHSLSNIYGHVRGYFEREVAGIESRTTRMLRGKEGINAFVNGRSSRYTLRAETLDNKRKPGSVSDTILIFNLPDAELARPVFHPDDSGSDIIQALSVNQCKTAISETLRRLDDTRVDAGQTELSEAEKFFNKVLQAKKFGQAKTKQFTLTKLAEDIAGINAVRDAGFKFAVDVILSALDSRGLTYQRVETRGYERRMIVEEYAVNQPAQLPDECFAVRLRHFNRDGLDKAREDWEKEKKHDNYAVDPFTLMPGLVIRIDVTTIKKRETTLNAVTEAAGEILNLLQANELGADGADSMLNFAGASGFGGMGDHAGLSSSYHAMLEGGESAAPKSRSKKTTQGTIGKKTKNARTTKSTKSGGGKTTLRKI